MALPDPSKTRPSMSSDTPILRLCPVNSTLLYRLSAIFLTVQKVYSDLLDIDTGGPFKHLSRVNASKSLQVASGGILERQLDSLVTYGISSVQLRGTGGKS